MKKKKITLLAAVLATAAMFTGCTIEDEYVPVDTEVQVMETNDIGVPSLSQTLDIPDDKIPVKIEFNDIVDNDFTGPRIKVIINNILIPECRLNIQYHNKEWITVTDTLDVDTRKDIFFYKVNLYLPKEFRERTEKVCIQTNIGKEN